jgi:hypothetical protein
MKGKAVVWMIVQAVMVVWLIYQLFAPGEAQAIAVIVMEWFGLIGVSIGLIMSVVVVAARK